MLTHLNFINLSDDANNSDVVIASPNLQLDAGQRHAIAWTVIQNCGFRENHPFIYDTELEISSSDAWGNFTPRLASRPGDKFTVETTPTGETLKHAGPASGAEVIELLNALEQGAIRANIYRSGRLFAQSDTLPPGMMAAFSFDHSILIGVAIEVEQGQILHPAIIAGLATEIGLTGIACADIVMTGGGSGADARPFAFTLQNVVMA